MARSLPTDHDPLGHALQMYAYYGAVSWQILGIFLAAGFILATLPFAAAGAFRDKSDIFHIYGLVNEFLAAMLTLFGFVLWYRYQDFAEKWARRYPSIGRGKTYATIGEMIVDVECLPLERTWFPIDMGRILAYVLLVLAIGYVVLSALFLYLTKP